MTYKSVYILLFFCHLNFLFTFTRQCWYIAFSWRQYHIKLLSVHPVVYYLILKCIKLMWGTRWHSGMRHYAASQKIAGSIPNGINVIFHLLHCSGCTMVLEPTQPLSEKGKCAQCIWLTLPPSHADCIELWEPQPTATLRAWPGLSSDYFIILN
jgi:hypothetical protein